MQIEHFSILFRDFRVYELQLSRALGRRESRCQWPRYRQGHGQRVACFSQSTELVSEEAETSIPIAPLPPWNPYTLPQAFAQADTADFQMSPLRHPFGFTAQTFPFLTFHTKEGKRRSRDRMESWREPFKAGVLNQRCTTESRLGSFYHCPRAGPQPRPPEATISRNGPQSHIRKSLPSTLSHTAA